MSETREQLESSRSHLAHEAASARRALAYWYERNRLLENAVRTQAAKCFAAKDEDEAQAAMSDLLRRVPKTPRKKWAVGRFTKQGRRH